MSDAMTAAPNLLFLADRLRQHVECLAQSPRVPGTETHTQAADYVRDQLHAASYATEEQAILPSEVRRYRRTLAGIVRVAKNPWLFRHPLTGRNILTVPEPDQPDLPLLIVGAHYDSVPRSPGADDNASAVAALLEIASMARETLPNDPLPCRVQFAAYDMEEYGILGSQAHARSLHELGVPVLGMICLEMLGFADHRPGSQRLPAFVANRFSNIANFIGVLANENSRSLCEAALGGFRTVEALPVESFVVPGRGEWLPMVRRSDHSSFWDCGYPAVMITDTSFLRNPNYHKKSDTPETLDYEFMAKVTVGTLEALRRLLSAGSRSAM